jgi:hypothetical protein
LWIYIPMNSTEKKLFSSNDCISDIYESHKRGENHYFDDPSNAIGEWYNADILTRGRDISLVKTSALYHSVVVQEILPKNRTLMEANIWKLEILSVVVRLFTTKTMQNMLELESCNLTPPADRVRYGFKIQKRRVFFGFIFFNDMSHCLCTFLRLI